MLTRLWQHFPIVIISASLAVFGLFFFLFPENYSAWNRMFLVLAAVAAISVWFFLKLGQIKRFSVSSSSLNTPVLLLLGSFILSTVTGPAKIASLLSPAGTGIVIVLSILYIIVSHILDEKTQRILLKTLLIVGSFFSVAVILFFLGATFKLFYFPSFWPFGPGLRVEGLVQNQIPESPFGLPGMTSGFESFSFLFPIFILSGYNLYCLFQNKKEIPCHSRVNGNLYNNYKMDPPVKLEDDRMGKSHKIILVISFFLLLTATLLVLPWPSGPTSNVSSQTSNFSLPYQSGWSIALDTLKQPKNALLGYGVANFPVAFNLNRPLSLNTNFTQSSNFPLQLLTENGLLGLLAFLYLLWMVFNSFRPVISDLIPACAGTNPFNKQGSPLPNTYRHSGWSRIQSEQILDASAQGGLTRMTDNLDSRLRGNEIVEMAFLAFWSTVFLMFILPPNLTLLLYFFLFLGILSAFPTSNPPASHLSTKTYDLTNLENAVWGFSITLIALIALIAFFASQAYLAEDRYENALAAISKKEKIGLVYSLLKSATDLNPYLPKYHQALSQTMLFWGTSLTQKDSVTEKDRQDAIALLQQAIGQAQNAIALNPQDSALWFNLGNIYTALVNSVKGADSWAQTALNQAVLLNPSDFQARFALSGFYIQLGQWSRAQKQLEIAVNLNPSFANGFYNLYYVQKSQGLYQDALNSLNTALTLVAGDASQSAKLQAEKTALEKLVGQNPSPSPTSPTSKLNLPESSSPPAHFKP